MTAPNLSIEEEAAVHFASDPLFFSNEANQPPDGNSVLCLGEYYDLKEEFGQITTKDSKQFDMVAKLIEVKPGVIKRGSFHNHFQTHDDYYGYLRACQILNRIDLSMRVLEHGKSNGWVYCDQPPPDFRMRWNSWFWRMPGVVQHIKICAARPLNWTDRVFFAFAFISTTWLKPDDTSGRLMDRLRRNAYLDPKNPNRYWLCDWAVKKFNEDIVQRYPNKFGDVYQVFFQRDPELKQPPTHLFARWLQGRL